jgi:hypothetical protein
MNLVITKHENENLRQTTKTKQNKAKKKKSNNNNSANFHTNCVSLSSRLLLDG